MNKILLLSIILANISYARFDATPIKECEAYNNMKHTKNSSHVVLDKSHSYTVLKKHKGQYLLLVKDASPAQRWVDSDCFSSSHKASKKSNKVSNTKKYDMPRITHKRSSTQSLLVLSWHNAFCETHRDKQECRKDHTNSIGQLVLHGLWPQPRNNAYCNVPKKVVAKDKHKQWRALPSIDIEPSTLELMDAYMPGYVSMLHKHEWIKHGTCYGSSADSYYANALSMTKAVDSSTVGKLLRSKTGKKITLGEIRRAFDKDFGYGSGNKVEMKCRGGLLTELWINTVGQGDKLSKLMSKAKIRKSKCRQAKVDAK